MLFLNNLVSVKIFLTFFRLDMALLYVANKNSSTIARNQWLLDYPDRRVPSTSTISNQWYKFKKFDTVDDRVSIFYTHVFSNIISLFRFLNSTTKKLISHGPSLLRRTRGAFMTTSCCKKRGDHLLGEMNLRTEDSKTSYNRITQELHTHASLMFGLHKLTNTTDMTKEFLLK